MENRLKVELSDFNLCLSTSLTKAPVNAIRKFIFFPTSVLEVYYHLDHKSGNTNDRYLLVYPRL